MAHDIGPIVTTDMPALLCKQCGYCEPDQSRIQRILFLLDTPPVTPVQPIDRSPALAMVHTVADLNSHLK